MDSNKAQKLQAVLYAHGGEMRKNEIARLLQMSDDDLATTTTELEELLANQGLELLQTNSTLSLRTSSEFSETLAEMERKDREKDIGTAGLEVLAIVLYKGEVSRATIDYIRGVNSSGTLRQLVLRGLLERTRDAGDARAWLYSPTPELLAHLGITSIDELPEFETTSQALHEPETSHNDEAPHE